MVIRREAGIDANRDRRTSDGSGSADNSGLNRRPIRG